jgi:hypothetical protein
LAIFLYFMHSLAEIKHTLLGTKYIIHGFLKAPNGSSLNVRSVWFINNDESCSLKRESMDYLIC